MVENMPNKKNNHVVPKCYLKHFSKADGLIDIFLLKTNQTLNNIPYSSQCQIDYYYGKDPTWEDVLGKLESDCAPIFEKIVGDKAYYPTSTEIDILRRFVIFQRSRTTAFNELADEQRLQSAIVAMKIHLDHKGIPYTDELLRKIVKDKLDSDSNIIHSNLELAQDVIDKIDDLGFVLVNYSDNLISSDTPVVMINPFVQWNIGYSTIGLIIFFPIGPNILALFYDRKMYPDLQNQKRFNCTDQKDIETLNAYQYILGNEVLLGSSSTPFHIFNNPDNEYRKKRKEILERDPTTVFGDNDHKLVISSPPTVLLQHELSFCRLLSDARKIPYACREPIPRIKEEGYEEFLEKIRIKNEFLPAMMEQMKRPFDSAKRKEFRQGTQKMERLANFYWKL